MKRTDGGSADEDEGASAESTDAASSVVRTGKQGWAFVALSLARISTKLFKLRASSGTGSFATLLRIHNASKR